MNQMLSRRGLPRLGKPFGLSGDLHLSRAGLLCGCRSGPGAGVLFGAGCGVDSAVQSVLPSCGLFPKAAEILKAVQGMGLRQLLVSASQQQALDRQVEEQGLTGCFEAQLGISNIYAGSKAGLAQGVFSAPGNLSPGGCVPGRHSSRLAGGGRGRMPVRAAFSGTPKPAGVCWRQRAFRCWTAWRRYSPFCGKAKGVKENNPART